ncbi:hypothetical protein ACSMEV_18055 [Pseudomonas sp. MLB6B]
MLQEHYTGELMVGIETILDEYICANAGEPGMPMLVNTFHQLQMVQTLTQSCCSVWKPSEHAHHTGNEQTSVRPQRTSLRSHPAFETAPVASSRYRIEGMRSAR